MAKQNQDQEYDNNIGDWMPRPDPTKLTTDQLNREILQLREHILSLLAGAEKSVTTLEKETQEQRREILKDIEHLKNLVDEKIKAVQGMHDEKFNSIQNQFKERDVRTEQSSKDSKVAVDAALQAAKEAVGEQNKSSAMAISKSEAATVKQIDQLSSTISAIAKGIDDKINDVKDRIGRMESAESALTGSKKTMEWSAAQLVIIASVALTAVLSIGSIIVTIWAHVTH